MQSLYLYIYAYFISNPGSSILMGCRLFKKHPVCFLEGEDSKPYSNCLWKKQKQKFYYSANIFTVEQQIKGLAMSGTQTPRLFLLKP